MKLFIDVFANMVIYRVESAPNADGDRSWWTVVIAQPVGDGRIRLIGPDASEVMINERSRGLLRAIVGGVFNCPPAVIPMVVHDLEDQLNRMKTI